MITPGLIRLIMPRAFERADTYASHLESARQRWVGSDPLHVGMWLAQIAHESGELRHVLELEDGSDYEGRRDLGNTEPGDGPRFRGRGLIQLTGRDNYRRCGGALGLPLLDQPELLARPDYAAASAGWFWSTSNCGDLMVEADPLLAVTRRINGGTNGLESRRTYWQRAQQAMQLVHTPAAPIVESVPVQPAPEAPAVAPASEGDQMNPEFLRVLAGELLKVLPWYAGQSERAQTNVRALQTVAPALLEAAKSASGESGVAEATQAVVDKPAVREAFVREVAPKWEQIEPALRFDEASRAEARSFADRMTSSGPIARQIAYGSFMGIAGLLILGFFGWLSYTVAIGPQSTPEMTSRILDKWDLFAAAVVFFLFGSSIGSRQKDSARK